MSLTRNLTQPLTRAITRSLTQAVGGGGAIAVPTGFPTPIINDATFSKVGDVYTSSYEPAPFLVEGASGVTTKYVDVATGNDANPGTSAQPFKSIYAAIVIARGTAPKMLVRVKGGTYNLDYGFKNKRPEATELQLESWDGLPVTVTNDCQLTGGSWTLDTDNTYYATVPGYTSYRATVFDFATLDSFGDPLPLRAAASLAACKATPGTFWGNSALNGLTYVHTHDNRAPDANIRVYQCWDYCGVYNDYPAAPATGRLYVENFHFEGGGSAFQVLQTSAAYTIRADFKDCSFKYSPLKGSFDANGNVQVALHNCLAACSTLDGFSYHAYGAVQAPVALEIDCEARNCGNVAGSVSNQGSTMHDGGTIIRVNGNYHDNQCDQIADVSAGTNSWNMGCIAADSLDSGFAGFRCGNSTTGPSMWLDGCTVTGMTYSIACDTGSTTLTKDFTGAAGNTGAGTIGTY